MSLAWRILIVASGALAVVTFILVQLLITKVAQHDQIINTLLGLE